MEYIRRTSKFNIETNNSTLKFSLKGPVRTHHYLNTYIGLAMIIIMVETIALMANGDPKYQIQTPTRVGETERGKYLIYENKNEIDERNK